MTRLLAALVAAFAATVLVGTPAHAQDGGWVIERFEATIEVATDGTLTVTEDISVDFGSLERRGIFRVIPIRYGLPAAPRFPIPEGARPDDLLRAIDIGGIEVSSDTAPDDVEINRPGPIPSAGDTVSIRIGDPDVTISGRHRYVLRYRVAGAMNGFGGDPPELNWNVTGTGWPVPIEAASVTVQGGAVDRVACFRGEFGATATCEAVTTSLGARAGTSALEPGEGMTVVVGFEPGSVAVPDPILLRRWRLDRALWGSAATLPLTAVVSALALGGVGLLGFRHGRDRVVRGATTIDGRVGPGDEPSRRRRWFEPRTVPVRFRPPDGLRPGHLGVLVDERVDPVDISATVVDLAVRGHLRIEEVSDRVLWWTRTDWRLVRTRAPAEEPLEDYERTLLDGLFEDGEEVLVSDLKGAFATDYRTARDQLYEQARRRGWFRRRPDRVRQLWVGAGLAVAAVGAGLFVVGVLFTTYALVAAPLVVAGVVLAAASGRMPHRTAEGSRLLVETLGFRDFIVTAETDRMRFAEAEQLFVAYLPFAVVFGAVDRWARVFAELGVATATAVGGWYVGSGGFDAARFSSGLSEFSTTVGSSMATVPSSGGGSGLPGGSSGGGFGGGGGGSW